MSRAVRQVVVERDVFTAHTHLIWRCAYIGPILAPSQSRRAITSTDEMLRSYKHYKRNSTRGINDDASRSFAEMHDIKFRKNIVCT